MSSAPPYRGSPSADQSTTPTPSLNRVQLGALGEQLCAQYLTGEGYRIETRNWRGKTGELDIIAQKDSTLVIIEVRSRLGAWLEKPAEAVTLRKQRQVARCADEYLRARPQQAPAYDTVRFDVIGVKLAPPWSTPSGTFDHEISAFYSPWAF